MAEESPQPINPAVDPQVEDPPATAVPVAQVDTTPAPVDPAADPEVPQPDPDLPEALVYPAAETPTQDPIVVAQLQGGIIPGDRGPLRDLPRVPVETVTTSPITGPGAELPTVTVTAPRPPANDPAPVLIDETGTISNIQRNPETGELFNTGDPPQQLTTEQLQRLQPTPPPPDTPVPTPPAQPPASRVQATPAPAPAQDYGASADAANLQAAERAEAEAFRQGRIPQPVTNPPDPQTPATDGTTAGRGIQGQVPGISPYGEADDPREVVDVSQPSPASGQDYGSSYDAFQLEQAAARERVDFETGRVPQAVIGDPQADGLTESEVLPGFTADPFAAGENVGLLRTPAPLGLTESETIPGFTTDPRAAGENVNPLDAPAPVDPSIDLNAPQEDAEGEGELIEFTQDGPVRRDANQVISDAARDQALRDNLRNQQSIREQRRNNPDSADWRVRLRLAPNATYLYNADDAGILEPLKWSDGVIFPYTPTIQTVYKANYNSYDLTHSNYRGYFYQSSVVDDIQITGTFTAQDTVEAEYLLAVIHFFRSATKMFYGQDVQRGAPPPLVYLSAFGQFQYVDAPCVIAQFNYNLPADVDYIRARSPNQDGTNLLKRRQRQNLPTNPVSAILDRLRTARLPKGGKVFRPPPPTLGLNSPTYVPTRIDVTVVLHPMQSRKQISQQFSLKEYGSGRLQPKGYW